ncbi:MAG: quinolinate synthase NadA [Spirochaetales bacterium]|nr:quinolinate synthase NadA [Spirochaetales bacterium]
MSYRETNQIEYIRSIKKKYGDRILIPAHHYISSDIIDIADFTGDSYKLAVDVASTDAEFIVFAGVRFMAESAAVLAKPDQKIFHPVHEAGCPMADMIDEKKAQAVFDKILAETGIKPAPVVYMNSYASSKAFTGRNGGAVCTSSNAAKIIDYYLSQDRPIFFFPDYHLGRNIADKINIPEDQIVKISKDLTFDKAATKDTKIYLWDGFCHVHQTFAVDDIKSARERYPDIWVTVHPECDRSIVAEANEFGSTQQIYDKVTASPEGSKWAIGTEINFVERLATENPNKVILPLRISPCFNMGKITPASIASILDKIDKSIQSGALLPRNVVVSDQLRSDASLALNKMIEIVEGK